MIKKLIELKEKASNKIFVAEIALSTLLMTSMHTVTALAGTKDKDLQFLEDNDNKTFSDITDTAKGTGGSFYKLMLVVGAIGLVVSLIALGVSYSTTKNSTKKSENKSHLVDVCIGAILVFGAIAIIGLIKSVATKL